jgi:hypothetical protein
MLMQAVQSLIRTARDASATDEDFKAAVQAFCDAAGRSSAAEVHEALAQLAELFQVDDLSRAGFLALLCGAYVERGADPLAIAEPLGHRLRSLLESSADLVAACLARMPEAEDEGEDHDPHAAFEAAREELAPEMPREHAAWEALGQFWPPAIAVYSLSPKARAAARGLRELAAKVSDHHEAGHWLDLMLSVLDDDEPIVAIEPATGLGILGRISGVVENFQLNVLLMDGFPNLGLLARRRVPKRVADVAHGLGPQQTDDTVTGAWNLYTWQAIQPGLTLPAPMDSSAWIWNEGRPEDIPVFEGSRVILLGPPSYSRSWRSQRMFSRLPAELECERRLTKDEVQDWLRRMLAAKDAG